MPSTEEEMLSRRDNWHQSSVETIVGCARRYMLEYEAGLTVPTGTAACVGTAVHAALEAHELARAAGDMLDMEQLVAAGRVSLDAERDRLSPEQAADDEMFASMVTDMETSLHNWWHLPMVGLEGWEGSARDYVLTLTPIANEQYVYAQIVDDTAPLAGTIDGLYRTADGELTMLDWKTTAKLSAYKDADAHRKQAAFYSAILALGEEELDFLPRMTYIAIKRTRSRAGSPGSAHLMVQPDAQDLMDLGNRVRGAERVKEQGVYLANPLYKWCRTCPFRQLCAPGNGLLLAPLDQVKQYAGTGWRALLDDVVEAA